MKRRSRSSDEDIGNPVRVEDFLPPPEQLVLKDEQVKVTLALSRQSIEFFKAHAARAQVPYQRMIRNLLDAYVSRYGDEEARSEK